MAILGPSEGPAVLKLDSNPIKAEVMSHFGHPTIRVELEDTHFEMILRTAGDFMAGYFPFEEKRAYFYTKPLVDEYPLPADAYWIKDVKWDPSLTRVGDIFGAESYLFCFAPNLLILSDNGLININDWKDEYRAITPYGKATIKITKNDINQPLLKIEYNTGYIICTENHPIKINNDKNINDWKNASDLNIGDKIIVNNELVNVKLISDSNKDITYTVISSFECFYGCHNGDPVLVH